MADVTASVTLKGTLKGQGGAGVAVITLPNTVDAGDYVDMDTVLGEDVQVVNVLGQRASDSTGVAEIYNYTLTSTTPDRVTIGVGADNASRQIVVFFTGRSSTGGSA